MSANYKSFNYSPITINSNIVLTNNLYNVVYAESATPITVTLPNITTLPNGTPFTFQNYAAGTLTVIDGNSLIIISTVSTGQVFSIISDITTTTWRNIIGPITATSSGTGNVSGPGSTTNNALTKWVGTTGTQLANSVVVVDGLGNMSGVRDVTISGQLIMNNGIGTATVSYGGTGSSLISFPATTTGGLADTVVYATTPATLLSKNITDTASVVYASGLRTATSTVVISAATAPTNGQVLVASSGTAATWTTITSVPSFSGSLAGQVTGPQSATVIASNVITDANIATNAAIANSKLATLTSAGLVANSATTATAANTASAIVARDASGNFAAGTITASLTGNVTGNVSGSAASFTGSLAGVVTGTQSATTIGTGAITNTMLATITTAGKVANSATTATTAGTDGTIVLRDNTNGTNMPSISCYGNIVYSNGTGAYMSMNGGNSNGYIFTDITGPGDGIYMGYNFYYPPNSTTPVIPDNTNGTTLISCHYNNITFGVGAAGTAPTTYWTIRSNGNLFSNSGGVVIADLIGNVTGTTSGFSGSLSGQVTGTQNATVIAPNVITDSMISSTAAISDTKLATLTSAGKVANSATTATSANTVSAIVARDASGNFVAGTITANLTGNVTGNVSGSAASFTGSLAGVVTGTQSATTIGAGAITNTMLATITTAGKVANSATTATAAASDATIVLRDNTNGTNLGLTYIAGNLNFNGTYRSISMIGGNSTGYYYANMPALGDGLHWGYNCYYPDGTTTPSIPVAGSGTSRVSVGYGTIQFCTGTAGVAPTAYWSVASNGTFTSLNSATISANLTGNVTGNVSGSAASFTGSLAGVVTGTQSATTIGANAITNTMLATITTAGKVANSATTATSSSTANTIVLRNASNGFSSGAIAVTAANVQGAVQVLSGASGSYTSIGLGRVAREFEIGIAATTGSFISTSVAGDVTMINSNSSNSIIFGVGTSEVSRFTSNGTVNSMNLSGNLAFMPMAGSPYRYLSMGGGNSTGYMYGNFNALGDGMHWGYNCYYPDGSTTATIPNTAGGTSRISVSYENIVFATGTVNTAPVNYWTISSVGNLVASNGAIITSNVTGNVSGSAASFTGSLAGVVTGTQSATTIGAAAITNTMLATLTTAGLVANSATTATASNVNNTIVLRDTTNGTNLGWTICTGNGLTYPLMVRSGLTNNQPVALTIGRTTSELFVGICGSTNQFFTGTVAGDAFVQNTNASNSICMGITDIVVKVNSSGMSVVGLATLPNIQNQGYTRYKSLAQTQTISLYSPTKITSCVSSIASGNTTTVFTLLNLTLAGVRPQFTFSGNIVMNTTDATSNSNQGICNISFAAGAARNDSAGGAPTVTSATIFGNNVNTATGNSPTYTLGWSGNSFQLTFTTSVSAYGVVIMSAECFAVENIGVLRGTITTPTTSQTITTFAAY